MDIKQASTDLVNGNLTTKVYNVIQTNLQWFLRGYKIPKHLDVDDIISVVITKAYNNRHQFNSELSLPITWLYTIARYEVESENKKQNNRQIRIPETCFADNQIQTDHGIVNIFETLDLEDDASSFNMLFNDSGDISVILYEFILENNLSILEEFLYNNLSMKEICDKHNLPMHTVKNKIRSQRLLCIENFTGTKQNAIYTTIPSVAKNPEKKCSVKTLDKRKETYQNNKEYAKEYREKNKEKYNLYQLIYRNKNKNK